MSLETNLDFNPKVSIIIPVYNGSNYMREAINSAIAQTYRNVEIIVINDGSNDDGKTKEIALGYGDKIRYFYKENGGVATALNLGIKNMKGEYFSWLSHDDIYYKDKIEVQIGCLKQLEDKCTISYGSWDTIDYKSKIVSSLDLMKSHKLSSLNKSLYCVSRGLIHGCSLLIPKKCFDNIGLFDETLKTTQDYDLWFKFLRKTPIQFHKKILIKSRVHDEQTSLSFSDIHLKEANDLWINFVKSLDDKEIRELNDSAGNFHLDMLKFLKSTPFKLAYEFQNNFVKNYVNNIKISVIIPFYNRDKQVIDAVKSVLNQSHKNFEIILVNDGSAKEDSNIVDLCNQHHQIKYFSYSENRGTSYARNYGVDKSKGEYIAFLDSDDIFYEKKLEQQLWEMEKKDTQYHILIMNQ